MAALRAVWGCAASVALLLGLGCGRNAGGADTSGLASGRAPEQGASAVSAARGIARADARIGPLFAAPSGWRAEGSGFVARRWSEHDVGAKLPSSAAGPFEVGLGASEVRLRASLEGARPAAARIEDEGVVYAGAYASTDVVMLTGGGRFEELLLLRDASAPAEFAWSVDLGAGVAAVRTDDEGVRFEDATGTPRLHVPRPYALDATGVRRDAELAWTSGRLSVSLDTSGLVFPVLLDPAVESYVWLKRLPAAIPPARDAHTMVYDAARGNSMIFAGEQCSDALCSTVTIFNDTWTWDGTNWTNRAPASPPPGRSFHAMSYDSTRQVSVLFGGFQCATAVCLSGNDLADTWEWNGTTWAKKSPTTSPPIRDSHAMVYDAGRKVTVLFGGEQCTGGKKCSSVANMGDTWEYNGTTWTQRTPAASPAARQSHGMVFDTARNVTVLFGGYSCNNTSCGAITEYGDTWEYNGTTWTKLNPAASPPARDSFGMAYDSIRGKTVLFSGSGNLQDTWEWDGTNWALISPPSSPPGRYIFPMVFDSTRGRSVFFAGNGLLDFNDTWEYWSHGGACTTGTQCDTGFCVDGVCCDTASCGTCQACNMAASPGTCAAVTNAPDPDTCTGTKSCSALGQCKAGVGQPCPNGNTDCANGACVDGFCCNSTCTGACQACAQALGAPADGTCGPAARGYSGNPPCSNGYVCNGTSPTCPATCSADADCASGYFCAANGTCTAQKAQGAACNVAAGADCLQGNCRECTTGNCVDGVCCSSACNGACQVCAKALGAPADGTCGMGPAGYAGRTACSPYVCSGSAADCPTSCTDASACVAGAFCMSGHCVGQQPSGTACGSGGACASGFCVDGVCCNGACGGQCEACDISGSEGTCAPVAGNPHGTRPACPTGSADNVCSAALCDGNTRASCAGFAGSSVSCRASSCADGVATVVASCDGTGSCPTAVTVKCAPYVCAGTSCGDHCAGEGDCASGNRCDVATGKCVAGVTCDGQHTITGANGEQSDCSPYACNAGGCLTSCNSVADCASPAVCNGSGQCVPPPDVGAPTGSTGGCAIGAGRMPLPGGEPLRDLTAAVALVALVRRRSGAPRRGLVSRWR